MAKPTQSIYVSVAIVLTEAGSRNNLPGVSMTLTKWVHDPIILGSLIL